MADKTLAFSERRYFVKLLNHGGYVLNFSSNQFDQFTTEVVGVPLVETYQRSKGASLEAYLAEAPRRDSVVLLNALMEEWQDTFAETASEEDAKLAARCLADLEGLKRSIVPLEFNSDLLKDQGFTSAYLDAQRALLQQSVEDDPTVAIGTAKEIVESCCRTILEERGVAAYKDDDLPKLVDKTTLALSVNPRGVAAETPGVRTIRTLLGNLATVAKSLAELRNSYGSGHGKPMSYSGLTQRHARLAAGASMTLVQYLWDTHLERPHEANVGQP